jgi:malonate-semialdehyde dehydrogenase (acetylating)/methylmalonate-semialdehyde dehydrogenase
MTTETISTLKNYIGGEWVESAATDHVEVHNPATGDILARTPLSSKSEVEQAIAAAAEAFPAWRDTPAVERARVMFRFKALLEDHFEELSQILVEEHGKTLVEARGDVRRGMEVVEFACGVPSLLMGQALDDIARGIDTSTFRVPLGVCAGICPFNFPAMVPMWMFPLAIACGNTFVFKPSEKVPRTGTRLVELLADAGLPRGVMNIAHGAREAVDTLLTDPRVRAVSFVGSSPVAKHIYETSAAHGKRVQALAGAKNFSIVMPDADMRDAAKSVVTSAFGCAGQRCLATSVVIAVGDAGDPLVAEMTSQAKAMKMGSGLDEKTELGPVITPESRDRICDWIARGAEDGAELVLDGRDAKVPGMEGGFWVGATILDKASPGMAIVKTEVFGPVLTVIRTKDLDEAIEVANGSLFGNCSSIYTRSGAAARTFRKRIEVGMVGINVGVPAPMAFFPFAGWKGSFYGDLHGHGRDGVTFYTEQKVEISRWPRDAEDKF